MRSPISLVAGVSLLALAVVVAVVVEAPATLLDNRVDLLSGGRIRVANAKGTVWRGSGELTLLPMSADERRLPISWRVKALPILWGDIAGTLNGDDLTGTPASFSFSRSRTTLQNFVVALPASALLRVANIPSMLTASGDLEFNVESVSMTEQAIDGHIVARWQGADLAAPPLGRVALGDVRLDLAGQGGPFQGKLSNVGGEVDLSGTITFVSDGRPRLDMVVQPRPNIDSERKKNLVSALSMIGAPNGAGGYRLVWPRR